MKSILWGLSIGLLMAILADQYHWSTVSSQLVQKLEQAREVLTVWDILAMPVLLLVVLGTHEVGHLIGGMLRGMRFLMPIVGPFGWLMPPTPGRPS